MIQHCSHIWWLVKEQLERGGGGIGDYVHRTPHVWINISQSYTATVLLEDLQYESRRLNSTMMLIVLLFFCGTIVASNDTLYNIIPSDERIDLKEQNKEDRYPQNRTLNELFMDAVHAYLEEDWDYCIENFNAVSHG